MRYAIILTFLFASFFSEKPAFSQSLEQRVDTLFTDYNRPTSPGASVAIFHKGKIAFEKSYGSARLKTGDLASSRTNYRLASLTKAFTATAIMILKERGDLNYSDTLTSHLPDFPAYGKKITIRHLLNHLSGLRDYEDLIPSGTTKQVSDADVVRILSRQSSTYFTPGSQYRYSNSGYATLAHLVAVISGKSFASFLKDEIFSPLGMFESLAFENGVSTVSNRAYGHELAGGRYSEADQSLTSAVLGDGGVYTSVYDYFLWDQSLYTGLIVSKDAIAESFTGGQLADGSRTNYGFGWQLDTWRGFKRISHTGSTIGFKTAVTRVPEKELTVIVLVNRGNATPWVPAKQILDIYSDLF